MEMTFHAEDAGELTLLVVLHTAVAPLPEDWAGFEQLLRHEKLRSGANFQRLRTLVVSDGGAPNTAQRSNMQNEIWEGRPMKMSLLTNSLKNPVKRGIAMALTWMNEGFKICSPADLHGALVHLELLHEFERVWSVCGRLQAVMPPIATLEGIADSLKRPRWKARGAGVRRDVG